MNNFKIVKIISVFVTVVGLLVMIGWIYDIEFIKSVAPGLVTMKFVTALCFVLSGLLLYGIVLARGKKSYFIQSLLPLLSLLIFFFMGSLLMLFIFNIQLGIENLFVRELSGAALTSVPGRPSLATVVAFILVAIAGIVISYKEQTTVLEIIGVILVIISLVAVAGYIFDVPGLYYYVELFSTAMALHTAVLFGLIGLGLFLAARPVE